MDMMSIPTERTRSTAVLPFKHPFTAICCGSTGSDAFRLATGREHGDDDRTAAEEYGLLLHGVSASFRRISADRFPSGRAHRSRIGRGSEHTDRVPRHDDGIERRPTQRFYARFSPSTELHHNIVQNLFNSNKNMTTMSLNAQYLVFF